MKRIMACFLALVLAFCTVGAMAAGRENKLVVGSTTALSGNFFSPAFGSNTSDLDVQTLLHGYHLAKWNGDEGSYVLNDRVVTSLVKTEDSQGNRTYTLTLCEDLRYSDGTPITARDYAFSILLNASAQMAEIGGAADGGDVDRDACRRTGGVAPGERYAEFLGQLPVTLHELFGPRSGRIVGQRE